MVTTVNWVSAASNANESVVFPEPAGPSMAITRVAPHAGGAASTSLINSKKLFNQKGNTSFLSITFSFLGVLSPLYLEY